MLKNKYLPALFLCIAVTSYTLFGALNGGVYILLCSRNECSIEKSAGLFAWILLVTSLIPLVYYSLLSFTERLNISESRLLKYKTDVFMYSLIGYGLPLIAIIFQNQKF